MLDEKLSIYSKYLLYLSNVGKQTFLKVCKSQIRNFLGSSAIASSQIS
jgi:hypothetical protein